MVEMAPQDIPSTHHTSPATSSHTNSAPGASPRRSVWIQVLTTVPRHTPPPPQSRLRAPAPSQRNGLKCARTQSTLIDAREANDGVNENQTTDGLSHPDISRQQAYRRMYKPHGPWAWADGVTVEDAQTLLDLRSHSSSFSMTLKRGYWNGHSLAYLSKAWLLAERREWRGAYTELAMYKSMDYLRPLQGLIVPPLLGVYMTADSVSFAMQPPHPCFWMEAHRSMPTVLKIRVLDAYKVLHTSGILHGSVEPRNILIGADAKVTIVNFQNSRSTNPNPEVTIRGVTVDELCMEFRQVMYLLDVDGARKDEDLRSKKHVDRLERNRRRQILREAAHRGKYFGHVEADEELPPANVDMHPIPDDILRDWRDQDGLVPRRVVVPTRTVQEVSEAVKGLLDKVQRMRNRLPLEDPPLTPLLWEQQQTRYRPQQSPETSQPPHQPAEAPSTTSDVRSSAADPLSTEDLQQPDSRYNLRKRKTPSSPASDAAASPAKRSRISLPKTTARRASIASTSQSAPATPQTPLQVVREDLPPAKSQPSNPPKPIQVRDYANEPYSGAKGFYVPHPPTENRIYSERAVYIRRRNEEACLSQKLPYPRHHQKRPIPPDWKRNAPKGSIELGRLKRKVIEMEDPDTIERQAALKKQRYLDGRTADEGHNTAFAEMDEQPDVTDGPRILSRAEFTNRPTMPSEYAAQSSSNFGRGILKPTSPITTFPYWGEGFTEPSDLTISPKLGPSYYIQVHETETRPFLDPVTDWRLPPPREDVANIDHLRDQIARSRKSPHGRQSEGDRRPTDLRLCVGFAPRTRPARDFLTDGLSSTRDPDMGGTSPGQETRTLNRAVLVEESSDSEDEAVVEAMLRCDEAETACSISPLDDLQDRVRSWMRSVRGRRPH